MTVKNEKGENLNLTLLSGISTLQISAFSVLLIWLHQTHNVKNVFLKPEKHLFPLATPTELGTYDKETQSRGVEELSVKWELLPGDGVLTNMFPAL